jgi:hypothetical protein
MSASTRTAQQSLGIQFGAILAIVALMAALAFAVGVAKIGSGTGAAPNVPALAAPATRDRGEELRANEPAAVPAHDRGWDYAGNAPAVQPHAPYAPPPGYWKSNGRGGVEFVEAPVIHGPRIAPE